MISPAYCENDSRINIFRRLNLTNKQKQIGNVIQSLTLENKNNFCHFFILAFISIGSVFAVIFAWFAILVTGQYPKSLFDFNVGVMRWWLRVEAYAFLLVTDSYPPFSLH